MKTILFSLGTRGDIEPFLAICEQLQNKGHEVVHAFPIKFQGIAEEVGARMKEEDYKDFFMNFIEKKQEKNGKGN